MKNNIPGQSAKENSAKPQTKQSGKRPENKDNLDSREGEEQLRKGDDITHNKKEKHNEPSKHKG